MQMTPVTFSALRLPTTRPGKIGLGLVVTTGLGLATWANLPNKRPTANIPAVPLTTKQLENVFNKDKRVPLNVAPEIIGKLKELHIQMEKRQKPFTLEEDASGNWLVQAEVVAADKPATVLAFNVKGSSKFFPPVNTKSIDSEYSPTPNPKKTANFVIDLNSNQLWRVLVESKSALELSIVPNEDRQLNALANAVKAKARELCTLAAEKSSELK